MNLTNIITTLTGAVGILSFAAAFLNGKRKDGNLSLLQHGNDELRKQIDDKDKIIAGLVNDKTVCEGRVEILQKIADEREKARLEALELAQSRPAFDMLGTRMVEIFKQNKQIVAAITRQGTANSKDMHKVIAELANLAKVITSKER